MAASAVDSDEDDAEFQRELAALADCDEDASCDDPVHHTLPLAVDETAEGDELGDVAQPDSLYSLLRALQDRDQYFLAFKEDINVTENEVAAFIKGLGSAANLQVLDSSQPVALDVAQSIAEGADVVPDDLAPLAAQPSAAEPVQPGQADLHMVAAEPAGAAAKDLLLCDEARPEAAANAVEGHVASSPADSEWLGSGSLEAELAREREAALQLAQIMESDTTMLKQQMQQQMKVDAVRDERTAQLMEELEEEAQQKAQETQAALCISRAWKAYRSSPAFELKLQASVLLQAAWRGVKARRLLRGLQHCSEVIRAMDDAVASGDLAAAEECASRGAELGVENVMHDKLSRFRSRCAGLTAQLQHCAANGTFSDLQRVTKEAGHMVHLQPLLAACKQEFARRQSAALANLQKAVADEPMPAVLAAINTASQLGVPPAELTGAMEASRLRDAGIAQQLKDAAAAHPFSGTEYAVLVTRAKHLELTAELGVAETILQRRRARVAASLEHRVACAATAADAKRIIAEAANMGATACIEGANAVLERRQVEALEHLQSAALHGTHEQYHEMLALARHLADEHEDELGQVHNLWQQRQEQAAGQLMATAAGTSMVDFQLARGDVQVLEGHQARLAAEILFRNVRSALCATLQHHCSALVRCLISKGKGPELRWLVQQLLMQASTAEVPLQQWPAAQGGLSDQLGQVHEAEEVMVGYTQALQNCVDAALNNTTELTLVLLELAMQLASATESQCLAMIEVKQSYWGEFLLLDWGDSFFNDNVTRSGGERDDSASAAAGSNQATNGLHLAQLLLALKPLQVESSTANVHTQHAPQAVLLGPGSRPLEHSMLLSNVGGMPLQHVTKLDLTFEDLTSLDILPEMCPQLQVLLVNNNQLRQLPDVWQLSCLEHLCIKDNCLAELRPLPMLQHPASTAPRLQVLQADGNRISELHALDALQALQSLSLADNNLQDVGSSLHGCLQLQHLTLAGNRLQSLSTGLVSSPLLHTADFSRNLLTTLEGLANCPLLTFLDASTNRLPKLPESLAFPQLLTLRLSSNQLTHLPSTLTLPTLRTLLLRENRISHLPTGWTLPALQTLDLSFNILPHLRTIYPLCQLPALRALQLNDNPLAADPSYPACVALALPWLSCLDHEPLNPQQQACNMIHGCMARPAMVLHVRSLLSTSGASLCSSHPHIVDNGCGSQLMVDSTMPASAEPHHQSCSAVTSQQVAAALWSLQPWQYPPTLALGKAGDPSGTGPDTGSLVQGPFAQDAVHHRSGGQVGTEAASKDWLDAWDSRVAASSVMQAVVDVRLRLEAHLHQPRQHVDLSAVHELPSWPLNPPTASLDTMWLGMPEELSIAVTNAGAGASGRVCLHEATASGGGVDGPAPRLDRGVQQDYTGHLLKQNHAYMLNAAAQHVPPSGVLLQHNAFWQRQLQAVPSAAVVLQSAWRGRCARLLLARTRSETVQQLQHQAAAKIQAMYRGHQVRHGQKLLAVRHTQAMKAAQDAQRQALRLQEAERARVEAATLRIQAFARGLRVRKRLKAALEAARYKEPDDDVLPEFDDDFLDGLDSFGPSQSVAAIRMVGLERPADRAGVPATTARPQAAQPEPPQLVLPPIVNRTPSRQLPSPKQPVVDGHQHSSSGSESDGDGSDHDSQQSASEAGGSEPTSPGAQSAASSSLASKQSRMERHRQKLEALMAEWGFQDMATAEAALKRRQHQQGSRKKSSVMRSPEARLLKLKQQVEAHPKPAAKSKVKAPPHEPLHMQSGNVRGPPSRASARKPPPPPPKQRTSSSTLPDTGITTPSRVSSTNMDSPTAQAAGESALFTRNTVGGALRRLTDPASGADNEDKMSVHSFSSDHSAGRVSKLRHFQSVGAADSRHRVQLPLLAQHQPAGAEGSSALPVAGTAIGGSSRDGHVRSWAEQQASQSALALPQLQINGGVLGAAGPSGDMLQAARNAHARSTGPGSGRAGALGLQPRGEARAGRGSSTSPGAILPGTGLRSQSLPTEVNRMQLLK